MFQFHVFDSLGIYDFPWRRLLCCCGIIFFASTQNAQSEGTEMILATTPGSSVRMTVIDGRVPADKPGWFVELTLRAATQCKAEIKFAIVPWKRALKLVESGDVAASFNSSYMTERTVYGVYPMKGGLPDERRAAKRIVYSAYVARNSTDSPLIEKAEISGRKVVVERGSSVISLLEKQGATVFETAYDLTMLRMVLGGRVDAAIGIEDNIDNVIQNNDDIRARIMKVAVPIKKSVAYVMFSKRYYERHKDLVDCFWKMSADLRETEWFKKMRDSYR